MEVLTPLTSLSLLMLYVSPLPFPKDPFAPSEGSAEAAPELDLFAMKPPETSAPVVTPTASTAPPVPATAPSPAPAIAAAPAVPTAAAAAAAPATPAALDIFGGNVPLLLNAVHLVH